MSATKSSTIENYWKDDFLPLETAGKAILRELREDEAAGDLHRRMLGSGTGSHLYFMSQAAFQHERSIPLPPHLAKQLHTVKRSLLMGILPVADLSWMSVDHKLFLWSFDDEIDFLDLEITSKQCIVSVGIAKPKKGTNTLGVCFMFETFPALILPHAYLSLERKVSSKTLSNGAWWSPHLMK
jgi:hypothetical protein